MRKQQRGITIVELLVASVVLGLLGLLTVALFRSGASGWKKLEAQSTMLADYEVLTAKISKEVQRSVVASVDIDSPGVNGPTLSFLSAMDNNGVFALDTTTFKPRWQKYLIFYFDQANRKLYLNEVELIPGSPEADAPEPLPSYDAFTGNIEDYRNGGRLLMTDLDTCTFTLNNSLIEVEVSGTRKRYGDEKPEKLHMICRAAFRN